MTNAHGSQPIDAGEQGMMLNALIRGNARAPESIRHIIGTACLLGYIKYPDDLSCLSIEFLHWFRPRRFALFKGEYAEIQRLSLIT
jgi:hypothetical protein